LLQRFSGTPRHLRIDPGLKVLRNQIWKMEQEIRQVSFGIDDDRRDSCQCRFFQQRDAQTCFSGTGHTCDHRVSGQVGGVVIDGIICQRFGVGIVGASEIKT
jgi:hypothetical protein